MSNLPKGWKETVLSEIIDTKIDNRGRNPERYSDFGIPVIDNYLITGNRHIDLDAIRRYVDQEIYENFIRNYLNENDVLITLVGNGYGNVSLAPSKTSVIIQNTIGLRCDHSNDNVFLYYYLKNSKKKLELMDIGAAQPSIKVGTLLDMKLIIPESPDEQKAIANILSSLDNKIELLKEQNKTLETMAQTIFKEWFVNFNYPDATGEMVESEMGEIPKGWRVGRLSDEFDIIMGQSPNGESYNSVGKGTVFYQGRAEFQDRYPERKLFTTEPKRMAKKFDILLSVRAPVGDINVANEQCCIGRGLASVSSENKSYTLYKMKSIRAKFNVFESEGTVFGSINKSSLENLKVLIPAGNIIHKYEMIVSTMDEKIYKNHQQIISLIEIRNSLLPKLISGKIRVRGFDV